MKIGVRLTEKLSRMDGNPKKIARGFAAGIFIGMTPWFGFHILSALLIASLTRWSRTAAVIGVCITNPFTAPMIYPLNYWVGKTLTGRNGTGFSWENVRVENALKFLATTPDHFFNLLLGGAVLGLPLALAGYALALSMVARYRRNQTNPMIGSGP